MELQIDALSKRYGSIWAVRDFSLTLSPGILGLLGPNGAGKSTLMRMLSTVSKPTGGKMLFNGVNAVTSPDSLRSTLGYLPQDFGIYPHLNAVEFLEYMAALKGMDRRTAATRINELLDLLNLTEAKNRALGGYSGGMRQRVGIAQAMLNDPKLLIVDEPTTGLDPQERVRFRQLLSDLAKNRIIILSTHICSDIESIATQVAIVNGGQLLACASPNDLTRNGGSLEDAYLKAIETAQAA